MIQKYLAVAALAVASAGAFAQTAAGSPVGATVGPSQPSVPSVPSGSIYSRSTPAVAGTAAPDTGRDRASAAAGSAVTGGGIDPAYSGMDSRRDTAAMGAPAMGAMYLNGRIDDVRKTCPPGLVKRDYRCAPPADGVMKP
jgi:hypothetical protein